MAGVGAGYRKLVINEGRLPGVISKKNIFFFINSCSHYKYSSRSTGQSPIIFLLSVLQLLVLSVQYWLTPELQKPLWTGRDV